MRICHITSMHNWNDDRIFERACCGLAAKGHKVFLVAPAEGDVISEGVNIVAIPIRKRFGKHLLGPLEAFWRAIKVKSDIYHFYNPNMMPIMLLFKLMGKKVVIDIHENYEARIDNLPLPQFIRRRAIKIYRRLENYLCSYYDGITVVTESMRKKIIPAGIPILIVDNVPYLRKLESVELANKDVENPVIVTSGTHSTARNCIETVEALPFIIKEVPNVVLRFVGRFSPDSFKDDLKNRAKELGVDEHLQIEGMLPWIENFTRISKAQIGCVFYNDNLNNRVTLPNRLYEYMFCGVAILGEDFPEVRKVLLSTGSGLVVSSAEPKNIAEKALALLKDPKLLKKCSERGRNSVINQFNFEIVLDRLIDFYSKLVR